MIVVLGRPRVRRQAPTPVLPGGRATDPEALSGLPAAIALAVATMGSRVELVGSIGDDPIGDRVAVMLGRAGIGHAALLRDPAGHTPIEGEDPGTPPRLDAGDVGLGLGYLAEVRVLIVADTMDDHTLAQVVEAAAYHGARLVAVVDPGTVPKGLPSDATVLASPSGEDAGAFAEVVARYAVALSSGVEPGRAFADATAAGGWERLGR